MDYEQRLVFSADFWLAAFGFGDELEIEGFLTNSLLVAFRLESCFDFCFGDELELG